MRNIVLGLGALGAGAYTLTRGGVFQGDEEENNEVITGQFPGQGAGVGGSPITSGQAPGPSVNIEAPETQPMNLEGLDSGFTSKKEKESSDSSGSSSTSGSSRISLADEAQSEIEEDRQASVSGGGFSTEDGAGFATAPDSDENQETVTKKEKESSDIPASGPGSEYENNIETSKKEETSSDRSGIIDRGTDLIGGIF